jgi:hypothetical protein
MSGDDTLKDVAGKSRSLLWLLPVAFCALVLGCGRSRMPTVPVEGKVTWQGQPLTQGTVVFNPIMIGEGLPNRPAIGVLGPDGVYRLASFRPGDGALPGEYRVTVRSVIRKASLEIPDKPAPSRIPTRYGDPQQSGLRFTVPADARGPLVFDIDIKK